MNDRSIESSALYKQIVGNDSIMAEHKNKPLFEFTPFCKMIFSANRPPMTRDQSNAFFERWLIIPFETVYEIQPHGCAQMADTQLSSKLWHPAELSGLANRAVAGLQRVRNRGWRFDVPASVKAETDRYKLTADSVLSFLSETREKGDIDKDSQLLSEMYADYKYWCRDSGRHELSRPNFLAQIEELFVEGRNYRKSGRGVPSGSGAGSGWRRPNRRCDGSSQPSNPLLSPQRIVPTFYRGVWEGLLGCLPRRVTGAPPAHVPHRESAAPLHRPRIDAKQPDDRLGPCVGLEQPTTDSRAAARLVVLSAVGLEDVAARRTLPYPRSTAHGSHTAIRRHAGGDGGVRTRRLEEFRNRPVATHTREGVWSDFWGTLTLRRSSRPDLSLVSGRIPTDQWVQPASDRNRSRFLPMARSVSGDGDSKSSRSRVISSARGGVALTKVKSFVKPDPSFPSRSVAGPTATPYCRFTSSAIHPATSTSCVVAIV